MRRLQRAIAKEEGLLVGHAVEAIQLSTPKLTLEQLRASRGEEAKELRKVGLQIRQARSPDDGVATGDDDPPNE